MSVEVSQRKPFVPGGSRELLTLALPLILSNGFMTVQITLDRLMLSWYGSNEVAAAFPASMLFWLPFGLLQGTAAYVTTFVAQYTGANRPHRVGPAVWQGVYFSVITGLALQTMWPLAPWYVGLGGHPPQLQALEVTYFRVLCFAALPSLIVATVGGFFSGRGSPWPVLWINVVGTVVNGVLGYLLIFGHFGFPRLGIEGAGWATVVGAWTSAAVAMAYFLRPKYRKVFCTLSGWRPERALFARLMRFGGPAGVQFAVDILAFTIFTMIVGRLGEATAAAVSIAITFNLFAFLPMYGMGQAVAILVGQRLGENRPDLAERSTGAGFRWAMGYMAVIAVVFVAFPDPLVALFRTYDEAESHVNWAEVEAIIPKLLLLIAVYSLADSANLVYSSALRGAGDTRFVTWLTFALAWPLMVIPTYLVVNNGGSIFLAWGFASLYIVAMAACFWLRFRTGRWKSMRVIEPSFSDDELEAASLRQVPATR